MPEGDVVWRTAQRLHAALAGRVLLRTDLRWPSLATVDLAGRPVLEVVSAGKHLLTRVAGTDDGPGWTLHSHLRMEGSWHVHRTGEPWRGGRPDHGIRALLVNDTWTAVGHRLGMLDLVPTDQESTLVGHLGPDLLGPSWDAAAAVARLVADPARPVGEALLDQRVLAGVGTFFMCEALFLRGVTPWTPVGDAGDPAALVDLLHRLLTANRDRAVQSTTGDTRDGRTQYVHARSGRPCRRCGATVRVASIGRAPTDRVAFWCPRCQHGPTPTDSGAPMRPLGSPRPDRARSRPSGWT
ncbi:DNA-formamidopyrimidine glycosylase family protein [Kineosporia sp. A_224]|uniref:DNA-formamidopyrimidine glycosylase family protein n=1 Tax=Kineosporia sp. A_224 TaxID=1962180 RepID=UPI000B4BB223|nr:DNA-formamidopyrimidine glycosylase family protein [Kineosporia sp. A_224]